MENKIYGIDYNIYICGGIGKCKLLKHTSETILCRSESEMLRVLSDLKEDCCVGDIKVFTSEIVKQEYNINKNGGIIMGNAMFRGKKKDTNEWIYGFYYVDTDNNFKDYKFHYNSYIKTIYDDHFVDIQVEEETVGQYTGLEDKNGEEIYEGDIIAVHNPVPFRDFIGNVQLNDGCFELIKNDWHDCLKNWIKPSEIIGNVYDNPGLMEGND